MECEPPLVYFIPLHLPIANGKKSVAMFRNPDFLEVYFEIAPALFFLPPFLDLEGALGVRFYF